MRALEIHTPNGWLRGVADGEVAHWRGIPFAAPPVDELRWRAPQPVVPWSGFREAAEFGPICAQPRSGGLGSAAMRRMPQSEDCLTLNVTAPAEPESDSLPVMVFIHGGAYVNGAGSDPAYDGSTLVRRGQVVYVSINYRLGALGWMHFDEYATADRPIDSNLGLRDQLAALAWVQEQIALFGGDPNRVTVFGESAGAISITTMLASPAAEGLFAGAIAQSSAPRVVPPLEQAHRWTKEFLGYLVANPEDEDEVRSMLAEVTSTELSLALSRLSAAGLRDEPAAIPVVPAVDGELVPRLPVAAIAAGEGIRVPLVIGTCDREGTLFSHFSPTHASLKPTWKQMVTKAHSFVDPVADVEHGDGDETPPATQLREIYPGYPKRGALADLAGDGAFWYPSVEVMAAHSRYAPTFAYRYDYAPRLMNMMGVNATHGGELLPVFGIYDSDIGRFMTALGGRGHYESLSATMQDQWLSFAHRQRPLADWPGYELEYRLTMIFDRDTRVEADPRADRRRAWQAVTATSATLIE
ncbi:carboxylesterase [Enemella evansiae]|uniref:carboxylesterase/lipase family protein n=1 Tax=Enemella evansiae TaxID=2016499 RepID=UPI000B97C49F|nr:carboxylesterase/lipase family protein [Enemella evansiae]OYO19765.1 carboxylesterase [Enemella evansiae]